MFRIYTRKIGIVVLILSILVGMVACVMGPSEMEQQKMKQLESEYTKPFKNRAKLQYGKKAKVKKIEAETTAWNDTVWPIVHTGAGENLLGEIQVGKTSFEAMYLVDQDIIHTKKNAEQIEQSAAEMFEKMGMKVAKISVKDSAREYFWLPDEVADFSSMLENRYTMFVQVFVTSDLSKIEPEDFDWLMKYWAGYEPETHRGSVIFVQLGDPSKLEKLENAWNSSGIDFSLPNPRTYSGDVKDYVNVFEHYDVKASLYLSGDQGGIFYYQDANREEKRAQEFLIR